MLNQLKMHSINVWNTLVELPLSHPGTHSLRVISGEVPRTQSPANFFSIFVKFQRACQVGQ